MVRTNLRVLKNLELVNELTDRLGAALDLILMIWRRKNQLPEAVPLPRLVVQWAPH
jgi:hypothetical protein